MPKYDTLQQYIDTFNEDALKCYKELLAIVNDLDLQVKERLFAGQIAYYVEEHLNRTFHSSPVIVMAFHSDHVNVFASANLTYQNELKMYQFTKKGTMQIYYDVPIEDSILQKVFLESL